MSTIDDPRRVPTESGLATARANPTTTTTTTAAIAAAVKELATQYFHNTPEEKMVIFTGIITRHLQPLLAKVEIDAYSMQVLFEQIATALDVSTLTAADRGHGEMLCDILDVIDTREKRLAKVEGERDEAMEILDTVARGFDRSLGRLLVDDKSGAERELKLAITHVDNPHGYTGKSMAALRADLAAARMGPIAMKLAESQMEAHKAGIELTQLRADLAAKGEALKRYRETAANINSMWMAGQLDSTASGYHGKCAGEIANLKAIGVLLDEALASRADKGGAT